MNSHSLAAIFGGGGITCDASARVGRLLGSLGVVLGGLVLVDGPVENVVVLESLANKQVTEDLAKVAVVRLVVETKRTSVVQVNGELVGEAAAQDLGGGGHLLLHDAVVLLLLGSSLEALPWQRATAEVQHDVSERLHIVAARLLCVKVSSCRRGYGCFYIPTPK